MSLATQLQVALAAPGDLDTSFGSGGRLITVLGTKGGSGESVAVQSDGKIVVAGVAEYGNMRDFALARYLADGTLDASFGDGGKVTTRVGYYGGSGRGLAFQSDGKILVAGTAFTGWGYAFGLARYLGSGVVDTNFASGGLATTDFGDGTDDAYSVAVQGDGKIVVAGVCHTNNQARMAVVRYGANGALDTTFGSGGKVIPFLGSVEDEGHSVVIQRDGKIVVGGTAGDADFHHFFALVRLLADGTLDGSFGTGGKVMTQMGDPIENQGYSVLLQDDGRILLAGFTWGGAHDFALARYLADGTLDTGFGTGGKVITDFAGNSDELGMGAVLQSDGKIVVVGGSNSGGTNGFAVARYQPDGALDATFGIGGKVVMPFGSASQWGAYGSGVTLQNDGNIVVVGSSHNGTNYDLAVARFLGTIEPEIAVEQPTGINLTDGSANVDFGSLTTGVGVFTRTFTVRNSSTATLVGLVVSRDGANAEDVSVSQPTVTLLGPGGSTTFTVTFAPTGPGLRRATVHIASNDADENPFDISVSGTGVGQAGPGAVDVTFGSSGRVTTAIGTANDRVGGMALQSDGKLLVAGYSFNGSNYDFALLRYRDDLSLDTTFGNQGVATTPVGSSHDYGQSVAIQPDGKIVVVGNALNAANSDIAVVRYQADGILDVSFGNGGKVITSFSDTSGEVGWSVAVQGDGKIVVAGFTDNGTVHDAFAVMRYLADGAVDPSFGNGGKVSTAVGGADDQGYSVTLQRDGKIVVAGQADAGASGQDLALVRYLANGELDAGFGNGGKVITTLGARTDSGRSVTMDRDDTILVAGVCGKADINDPDIALVRYLPDGQLANGFGAGGVVITDIGGGSDDAGHSILLQSDGKIVVAGSSSGGANYDFAVVRYLASGTLDTGFGKGGKMVLPVGDSDDFGWDVAVQRDGKLVVAGDTRVGTTYDFAVVRLLGTTTPEIAVEQPSGNNLLDGRSSVDFGRLALNGGPASRTFTVRNASTASLTGLYAIKDGTQAGDFSVGALGTTGLGPGDSTTFSVTFMPSAAGARSAAIHIYSNDADESPFDIALAGTGLTGPEITTASPLPSGMVTTPYDFTFAAQGGALPYTWLVIAGHLPPGLSLSTNGLLGGTPTSITNASFTVRVRGDDSLDSIKTFSLVVIPALHPGDLDTSFGTGGKVVTSVGSADDCGYSAVVQPDGKIVVGGYSMVGNHEKFALARYGTDGSLDTSFGSGGTVTIAVSPVRDLARSVALQTDGKYLLAGEASLVGGYNFASVRLQTNGALDTTFGIGGRLTNTFRFPSYARTVLVQNDGRIVMAGELGTNCADYGLVCTLPDGTLDTSFGSGGRTTTDFGNKSCDYPQGAALQADGKILVAGWVPGDGFTDFGLVRYLVNGTLDPAFGSGGKVTTSIGTGQNLARSVAVQSDGRILVTGEVSRDFGLVRYLPDGSLDASFGSGGIVTTAIDRFEAFPRGMAVQSDGGIVVAGYTSNGKDNDFAVACYKPDGTLDVSFNSDGKLMTAIGSGHDRARSVVVQPDGKIVVAGESYNGTNYDFALVRYIGSLAPEIAVEHPTGTDLTNEGATVQFGGVALGSTSIVRTVTLRNLGSASLTGLAITKDGANAGDFSVETLPTTSLAPGASVSLKVTFSPSAPGPRTAAVHIASSDADESPFDLSLTGTGGTFTPLQSWRLLHFGSADNGGDGADGNDFDKDGFVNLLEYAFGGDPKTPDAAGMRPTAAFANGKLICTFVCDARCTDVSYAVQAATSVDASPWTDIAISLGGQSLTAIAAIPSGSLCEVSDTGTGLRRATVAVSATSFANAQGFIRVKITP